MPAEQRGCQRGRQAVCSHVLKPALWRQPVLGLLFLKHKFQVLRGFDNLFIRIFSPGGDIEVLHCLCFVMEISGTSCTSARCNTILDFEGTVPRCLESHHGTAPETIQV